LKSWWDDNGVMLIGAVVLAVAGSFGWRWYADSRAAEVARAADLYAEFISAEGEDKKAAGRRVGQEVPSSRYNTFVALRQAQQYVAAEAYAEAEAELRAALAGAPGDDALGDLARLRLARVLQQLDRSGEALEVLGGVRGEGFRPQVAELKGDIHLARGERALAHEAYSAALADLTEGSQGALLELKVADTADAVGA
jgi:predicted negative regulator of RcsB-dependent stress response